MILKGKNTPDPPENSGYGDDLADENVFNRMRGGIAEAKYENDRGLNITPLLLMIPLIGLLWGGAVFFGGNRAELASPLPVNSESLSGEPGFLPGIGGGPDDESTVSATPSADPRDEMLFDMDSRTREF